MKKILLFTFLFLPLFSFAEEQAPKFKCGVIIPLTGNYSIYGEAMKNSVLMASEAFDKEGAVKFIFEDDGFLPKNSVSAAKKLIGIDKVDALISFGSNVSGAVQEIAEPAKIPMIGIAITEKIGLGKNYVVRLFIQTKEINDNVVREVQRFGYKTVAIVTATQDGMLSLKNFFVENPPAKIVYNEEFLTSETDFKSAAAKIKSLNPDAVYILFIPPAAGIFAKELRALDYKGAFMGNPASGASTNFDVAKGTFDGMWFVTMLKEARDKFSKEYFEKYQRQYEIEAAYAHDAAKMMIEGLKSGDVNNYIHTVKGFSGAMGTYDAVDNTFSIPTEVAWIKDNKVQ